MATVVERILIGHLETVSLTETGGMNRMLDVHGITYILKQYINVCEITDTETRTGQVSAPYQKET